MGFNRSKGNMYEDTDTLTCLNGQCEFGCGYCSTGDLKKVYPNMKFSYSGPYRFVEKDATLDLGSGHRIFVCNTMDLFAPGVPSEIIDRVMDLCNKYPENEYLFQSKGPMRMAEDWHFPPRSIFGTTIETDDAMLTNAWSDAPAPIERMKGIRAVRLAHPGVKTFVTIEPVMRFDIGAFSKLLRQCQADWVWLGADSKHHNLTEPTWAEIENLIGCLELMGIPVKQKSNLDRLKGA